MYEADATFNTNELRLPLSVMVGITNTSNTFLIAIAYITLESAESFEFVQHELTKYVFFDCPEAAVIVADFTKGLGAAIIVKAKQDKEDKEREEGVEAAVLDRGFVGFEGGLLEAKVVTVFNANGNVEQQFL